MTIASRYPRLFPAAVGALSTTAVASVIQTRAVMSRCGHRVIRQNFHGRPVSLAGGVAAAAGTITASAVLPVSLASGERRTAYAALVATTAAAGAGAMDDLDQGVHDGDQPAKGLAGHLRALIHGHVTTGVGKIVIIGAGASVAGALLAGAGRGDAGQSTHARCPMRGVVPAITRRQMGLSHTVEDSQVVMSPRELSYLAGDSLVRAVTIASWANVHNLLDLRPGRALKAACALSLPMLALPARPRANAVTIPAASACAAGVLGVAGVSMRSDLRERTMLGDVGANAVGALVGTALASQRCAYARALAALTGTALVLASERVSFSRLIERTPVLHTLDMLGRRER